MMDCWQSVGASGEVRSWAGPLWAEGRCRRLRGACARTRGPGEVTTQHVVSSFWALLARSKFSTVLPGEGEAGDTNRFAGTPEESLQCGVSKNRGEAHAVGPPRPEQVDRM